MRRVKIIHALKTVFSPVLFRVYALLIFFVALTSLVSLENIILNTPSVLEYDRFVRYALSAFTHTEVVVKGIVVALCVLLLYVAFDAVRSITLLRVRRV